jgi:nucleoside-diphosphate-sugar epimerase
MDALPPREWRKDPGRHSVKILVTGATGFTGAHLARALAAQGHTVRTLARTSSNLEPLREQGFEIAAGDIRDADSINRAVEGIDQVYHLAAAFRVAGQPASYYREINVGGTRNILVAAERHGVQRVIHCSTVGVHGHVASPPADEEAPFNPGDIYQRTKLEAELLAREAFESRLRGVVVRPGAIYGPGDTRFLKLFRAIHRRRFLMPGPGQVHYHLVYIDDLVDGFLRCGSRENALGQVYILAGEHPVNLNEFAAHVARAVGVEPGHWHVPLWPVRALAWLCEAVFTPLRIQPPLYPRRVDFFRKERAFRIDKAKRELEYQPKVEPAEGIRRTAQWYFQERLLVGGSEPSSGAGRN